MSALRNLIDAVAGIAETVEGISEVKTSAYGRVGAGPAAVVELVSLRPDEPRELGAASEPLRRMVRRSVAIAERFRPGEAAAEAARDNVAALQGRLRRALENNPTLNGAALTSAAGRTRFGWETREGASLAAAAVVLDALVED